MRIGVIAAEMEGRSTGVGRYLDGLFHGLSSWDHGCEWHLFFQGHDVPTTVPADPAVNCHLSERDGSRVLWEQIRLGKKLEGCELDVLFGPAYSLPLNYHKPSAVTIHDLSFELFAKDFGPRERWRRRLLARRSARVASQVFVPSQRIRTEVAQRYATPLDTVSAIPHGVNGGIFSPQSTVEDHRVISDLGVDGPFILWLGTLFDRRMPREILQAFAGIRRQAPDHRLVIAGANRLRRPEDLKKWIDDLEIAEAVVELGWVEERLLAPLYREAQMAVYVSRYEGFGLPPLECLSCGTPVVVSHGLGLDDLWPDYPLRCPELSAEAIEATAMRALRQPELVSEVVAEAAVRSVDWSWENSSRALVAELRKVVRR